MGLSPERVERIKAALAKAKGIRRLGLIATLLTSIARGTRHAHAGEALAHGDELLLFWQIFGLEALPLMQQPATLPIKFNCINKRLSALPTPYFQGI